MVYRLLLCVAWLLTLPAYAQTSVFEETFESGTFGSFTAVNGTQTSGWHVGTAPGNGPRLVGQQAVFVSVNSNSYAPVVGTASVVHLYRDVTFPASETLFHLRFDGRSGGLLQLYLVPVSYQPVPGSVPPSSVALPLANIQYWPLDYATHTYQLPASAAGTTQRLLFTWSNPASGTVQPPALDNIRLVAGLPVALGGTYTINRQQPKGGRNYQSLVDANWDLHMAGTVAPVTLEVAAGQLFVGPLIFQGTNSHPLTIRRSGAGPNPQVRGFNVAIALYGASHVTFDGIDVVPSPAGTYTGYGIYNRNQRTGCRYVTVRNATITLHQLANFTTKGVHQESTLSLYTVEQDTLAANGHIRYENLFIRKANAGVWVESGRQGCPDYDVEVAHVTVGDTVAGDIGYPTGGYEAYGMYFNRLNGVRVHDNLIRNVITRNSWVDGLCALNVTGPRPAVFANNRIQKLEFLTGQPSVYGATVRGIRVESITAFNAAALLSVPGRISIYNNEVQQLRVRESSATTARPAPAIIGLSLRSGAFPDCVLQTAHNTIVLEGTGWAASTTIPLQVSLYTSTHGLVDVRNNLLVNTTRNADPSSKQTVMQVALVETEAETPSSMVRFQSNYNNLVPSPDAHASISRIVKPSAAWEYPTLSAWRSTTQLDGQSQTLQPGFAPGAALVPTNMLLNNLGQPLDYVTTDLAGAPRSSTPDVGAYEFGGPTTGTKTPTAVLGLHAWPVPFGQELRITTSLNRGAGQLTLHNALGRCVRTLDLPASASQPIHITNLHTLPSGPYWLRLVREDGYQQTIRLMH
ncbi:T9SS type A sorting domain-containing protein [Hymenobacter sp. 102]|uniref:T9SS type A sorting domain-containing protein n=1 Tax=Hymenobacter sp. 102 TaxID=3403152 RepID=UPI003CE796C9